MKRKFRSKKYKPLQFSSLQKVFKFSYRFIVNFHNILKVYITSYFIVRFLVSFLLPLTGIWPVVVVVVVVVMVFKKEE